MIERGCCKHFFTKLTYVEVIIYNVFPNMVSWCGNDVWDRNTFPRRNAWGLLWFFSGKFFLQKNEEKISSFPVHTKECIAKITHWSPQNTIGVFLVLILLLLNCVFDIEHLSLVSKSLYYFF